ncbi:hypothetical protein FACS189413_12570 [Bacteroidia bacterium]|nr:hypothetical protein FACS189413_12570 [Bacteroidia bacterium]
MRQEYLKAVLCAIMLFGAAAVHAVEKETWHQSGSLTERTENWLKSSSLRAAQDEEETTPPGDPWGGDGAPVGDGIWCIVGAAGLYLLVKTRKRNATGIDRTLPQNISIEP